MSEQVERPGAGAGEGSDETAVQATGNEKVDAVLGSMKSLEGRPVEEHVAIFESAHESLREALAGAGEAGAGPRPGVPGPR